MGQKINPVGLRLGINRTWDSRWFADGEDYGRLLHQDAEVLLARLREDGRRLGSANEAPKAAGTAKPIEV